MSASRFDTIVIGGGLHGLSAALHLARAGQRVAVLERAWTGRHASGASAAGVRTLGRHLDELPLSLAAMEMWHGIAELVGDNCGFHAHGQLRVAATEADFAAVPATERRIRTARSQPSGAPVKTQACTSSSPLRLSAWSVKVATGWQGHLPMPSRRNPS